MMMSAREGHAIFPLICAFSVRNVSFGSATWAAQGGDKTVSCLVFGTTRASEGRHESWETEAGGVGIP